MNMAAEAPLVKELAARIRTLSSPLKPISTHTKPRLRPMLGVRAVLFDVYGTLFISAAGDIDAGQTSDGTTALRDALQSIGIEGQREEAARVGSELLPASIRKDQDRRRADGIEYPEVHIRDIWKTIIHEVYERDLLDARLSDEEATRLALEYECRVNPVWPMPHLKDTLDALWRNRSLMGIVSNAQFFTPLLFDAFLGEGLQPLGFQPDLCAWSWQELEAKPSTALFEGPLQTLEENYGVSPDQLLYVGNDMLNDIWPAQKLGCRTALFAGDERSLRLRKNDSRCSNIRPTVVVTHLTQLLDILPFTPSD